MAERDWPQYFYPPLLAIQTEKSRKVPPSCIRTSSVGKPGTPAACHREGIVNLPIKKHRTIVKVYPDVQHLTCVCHTSQRGNSTVTRGLH